MNSGNLKVKVKRKIWDSIKDHFYCERLNDSAILLNLNCSGDKEQKRVLICYLTYGYFINVDSKSLRRTQPFEIFKIVAAFSELGYSVDLIGCNDLKAVDIVKHREYDLIFGFGETFYRMTNLLGDTKSILYMTENHPEFSYEQEKKRLDYFHERHGKKLKITRSGMFYKIHHLQKKYSQVLTMGETYLLKNQYTNPFFIFPTGLINPDYHFQEKDHLKSRLNFLWLGGTGAVHKGLDLLLDVFSNRDDATLYICGLNKMDRKLLEVPNRRNIFEHGFIDIKSEIFLEIVGKCSFLILPSCSEASSTSVTTGMLHGLIPVVMKDSGFNRLDTNAIFLDDFKIEYLDFKIGELITYDPEKLAMLSRQIFKFARNNFTLQVFERNFKGILGDIMKSENLYL